MKKITIPNEVIYKMKILKYTALTIGIILWAVFLIFSIYTDFLIKWFK